MSKLAWRKVHDAYGRASIAGKFRIEHGRSYCLRRIMAGTKSQPGSYIGCFHTLRAAKVAAEARS